MSHFPYAMFCDSGEPDCARCGRFLGYTSGAIKAFHSGADPECNCGPASRCSAYLRFYGEKAHIIPWSVCRTSEVENIIPLCHHCHKLNPEPVSQDTGRREYLDWLCDERDLLSYQRNMLIEDCINQHEAILAEWSERKSVHPAVRALVRHVHPDPCESDDEFAQILIEGMARRDERSREGLAA
jgi:hypothetical protein